MKRWILHVDMDAFFAAVEILECPELAEKPVVVGGDGNPQKRGVVSTASYVARKYGIYSGMPLRKAFKLCPHAIFLPVDMQKYRKVSQKIMKILASYTNKIEQLSLDEAFLDVTELKRDPLEIAKEIKSRIKKETKLTASIGIGPNKLLAKIASDLQKPDGSTLIKKEDVDKILDDLPVDKLLGVGPKTKAKLEKIGIRTIKELKKMELSTLTRWFGNSLGYMLYQYARGEDNSPVRPYRERKSISREITFQWDVKRKEILRKKLEELAKELFLWLEKNKTKARTLTLKIRYQDFSTHTRSITPTKPFKTKEEIIQFSFFLLDTLKLVKKVRLLGLKLSGFTPFKLPVSFPF